MRLLFKHSSELLAEWWRRLLHQWIKHYKLLFTLSFLILLVIGVYQWYYHLERYAWTEEEKKAFLTRTIQETSFQESAFQDVLAEGRTLREAHLKELSISRDLFLGKRDMDEE